MESQSRISSIYLGGIYVEYMEMEAHLRIAPNSSIYPVRQTITSLLKASDTNSQNEKLNLLEKKCR
jgi:hypothetical protein